MQIAVMPGTVYTHAHTHNTFKENKNTDKKVGIPKGMPTFAV